MDDYKQKLRNYYRQFKTVNPDIVAWVEAISDRQKEIIETFDVDCISVRNYDLPFPKKQFINNISSMYYKGRVGRRLDLLVYYSDVPLAYIQYGSPVMNRPLNKWLHHKFNDFNFKLLNEKVVDLSVCISFGNITKYLGGKLAVFVSISKEIVKLFDEKYNTNIEVVYTTSIFGKSSLYNRVRNLDYLGLSEGYHSILTKKQIEEIKRAYRIAYPHRKIKKSALAEHIIRMYDHLQNDGYKLSFEIPKTKRGVYVCDKLLPLKENLNYWYNRWFLPRRARINREINKKC